MPRSPKAPRPHTVDTTPYRAPSQVTAVLGPTNTGKTYYALERMCAHGTGMIGLPLRLLAREVYDRMCERKGERAVALVTGEEKITPKQARYWVCTVEAMPLEREVDFLAIDEVQLAADPERGRIFTERLLHARGRHETLFLGSDTMRPILSRLIGDIEFVGRERFSTLSYVGAKKITRLPRRSAIVAFSTGSVYEIAELVRRQRGGAAVVMGALSPRTRNAQAALYNEGEVDYLVATDAIGMGLNMDIDHVAFAGSVKFDGKVSRALHPAEVAQIAGRAGRHIRDGSWGPTGECPPFPDELIEQVENHRFDPVKALMWRSDQLDFASLPNLLGALERRPDRPGLVRARMGDDEEALRRLTKRRDIHDIARGGAALKLLWEICQVPDFRKVTPDQHAVMLGEIYHQILERGEIPSAFTLTQLKRLDRLDGDVDTLSNRIAHVRTWTYLSHRTGWLQDARRWQAEARAIEDALSDKLHEALTQRFIDRRTSVLLKKLKDDAPLLAGVTEEGEVIVEGEFVGRLLGFQFILDPRAKGPHAKAVRFAALKALRPELAARAGALAAAQFHEFSLRDGGVVWWRQSAIAQLEKGPLPLRPDFRLVAVDHLPAQALPQIEDRVRSFLADRIEGTLGPLVSLQKAVNEVSDSPDALGPESRGIGFRLVENFGAISRRDIADEVKALDQNERGKLRKLGVRFGEYTIHLPALLKPAPAQFLAQLWALWEGKDLADYELPAAGATSAANDKNIPAPFYLASGYRPSGQRVVRIDMLERLAQEIRTARQAAGKEGFEATARMMSLVGCSGEEFDGILQSLGFKKATVKVERPVRKPLAQTASGAGGKGTPPATSDTAEQVPTEPGVTEAKAGAQEAPEANAGPSLDPAATAPEGSAAVADTAAAEEAAQAAAEAAAAMASPDAPANAGTDIDTPAEGVSPETNPQDAAPTETEEVEITLWRWAPARPRQGGRPDARGTSRKGDRQTDRPKREDGPRGKGRPPKKGKGGKPPADRGPRTFTAGPGKPKKEADPDSPFAVLASLKKDD